MKLDDNHIIQLQKYGIVNNLMKYFSLDNLEAAYHNLLGKEIKHINKSILRNDLDDIAIEAKVTKINNIYTTLNDLYFELVNHSYFPRASTRVLIPKTNGKQRPLGLPSFRDKIVQSIMSDILISVYEPVFLDCSHGYRENRGCHTALKNFKNVINSNIYTYIVEADIQGFFDNISHQHLLNFINHIIKDKYFLMYIKRFLEAGVLDSSDNFKYIATQAGTPQGRFNFSTFS